MGVDGVVWEVGVDDVWSGMEWYDVGVVWELV